MGTPAFNPNAAYSIPAFDPSASYEAVPPQAAPQSTFDALTAHHPYVAPNSPANAWKDAEALFSNLGAGVMSAAAPVVHPIQTVQSFEPQDDTEKAISLLGPGALQIFRMGKSIASGRGAEVAGNVGAGVLAGEAAGAIPEAAEAVGNAAKSAVAGDVSAPIAGTDLTPVARYASMRNIGVQPNAAEATNSTPLNIAEKVNQNSLTAAPIYARARAQNLAALNDYTKDLLDSMSPKGPEEGGAAVQQGLMQNHADLKTQAERGFEQLDKELGTGSIPGAPGIRAEARRILAENTPYYQLHPELEPTKALAIVKDLSGIKKAVPTPTVVTGFGPAAPEPAPAVPRDMTYGEMHRLRSDLLDFNNTNPDLVKNQANGWISRLAGSVDQAITAPRGGLTPEQVQTFRAANEAWKTMKDTYDNPQSQLYQAVRAKPGSYMAPSTLVKGIQQTPEMAKLLQGALGPEGIGPIQRGVAENLLGTTKEGGYNFKNFQGRLNKLPEAYREALFTPEQLQHLEDIGNAGTVLHEDANPSGSARLGQGIAEGAEALRSVTNPGELAGNLAYHGAQYGLGKLMNSPRFVDWLMKGRGFTPIADAAPKASALAPAALATGAATSQPPGYYSDLYLRSKAAFDAARAAENAQQ